MLFIGESEIAFLEDMMWQQGFLDSRQMAGAFQLLRSNDLIWSHMVRSYLIGEREPVTDLMAWNADATRMPYRMHCEYLRRLFLKNDLAEGRFIAGGHPVALSDIRVPIFAVGTVQDHVAPWRSTHKIHLLTDAAATYVLTTGGHNAGIVSEIGHDGRSYQVMTRPAEGHYVDPDVAFERTLRWSLVAVAIIGLATGILAHLVDQPRLAHLAWTLGTIPVLLGLAVSIVRDVLAGRVGVDAVALLSMATALLCGEPLAGAVVALMYSGGNVLEDLAVFRAERDLRSLVDRAPRVARRHVDGGIEDVPVVAVAVGDRLLVRAGEGIPVDGIVDVDSAMIDESALTGEPIPVARPRGCAIFSGTLNAGDTFDMTASSSDGRSTCAGILRLVTAAQTAKAPFVRLADRYALAFLPVTVVTAGIAWLISGDLIRSLAVLVAATPCPAHSGGTRRLHSRCRPGGPVAEFSSKAAVRSRRWRGRTPFCSTRPER